MLHILKTLITHFIIITNIEKYVNNHEPNKRAVKQKNHFMRREGGTAPDSADPPRRTPHSQHTHAPPFPPAEGILSSLLVLLPHDSHVSRFEDE